MGDPVKPETLTGEAAAEWDRMVERLRLAKTLAMTDDAALYDYVQMHALADRLQETVDGLDSLVYFKHAQAMDIDGDYTTHKEPKVHPAVGQLRQTRMALRRYLAEFGLVPTSRHRVEPVSSESAQESPFARFIARTRPRESPEGS